MFQYDSMASEVVQRGLQSGVIARIAPLSRIFVCFALSHQEVLEMHQHCLALWQQIVPDLPPNDPTLESGQTFRSNYDVIARFGRFPGRNALLGRESTPEELGYIYGDVVVPARGGGGGTDTKSTTGTEKASKKAAARQVESEKAASASDGDSHNGKSMLRRGGIKSKIVK